MNLIDYRESLGLSYKKIKKYNQSSSVHQLKFEFIFMCMFNRGIGKIKKVTMVVFFSLINDIISCVFLIVILSNKSCWVVIISILTK